MTDGPVLPRSALDLLNDVPIGKRHPGLQLDKYSSAGDMRRQRQALEETARAGKNHELLEQLIERRNGALETLGATRHRMRTRGAMTLHLSRSGALENAGISLHPVYGFVYLPGSGIKGLVRAWAETAWLPAQADREEAWKRIDEAFGWSAGSERHKTWREAKAPEGSAAGRLVFHDAWPEAWPDLAIDIVNNHHVGYYNGSEDPGDWEDPVPVYFLAIGSGVTYDFPVSDRLPGNGKLIELAGEWLAGALATEGAGAKTAAGYGRFEAVDEATKPVIPGTVLAESHDLRLASPAFLAGAGQKAADCDLRPATMRGLLRWWWRTMHAGHLDRDSLRRLETAIWGNAQTGSAVRLSVDRVAVGEPREHPDKQDRNFAREHDISSPPQQRRVTQGLFYASYGMAERQGKRWYSPAGSRWRITLSVRKSRFQGEGSAAKTEIDREQVLQQARAALWLLARFGGAGSRSRKGFGSFDDVKVPGIASVDDCRAAGESLRKACGIGNGPRRRTDGPALEETAIQGVPTPWLDPWYAIDQAGMALQLFAKSRRNDDERMALGLPRTLGRGREGRTLQAGRIRRHASPAIWSLSTGDEGRITVWLVAFTAPRLPEPDTSRRVMGDLVSSARQELENAARENARAGQRRPGAANTGGGSATAASRPAATCEKGSFVEAVLLEERTRKGGWRARHEPSGKEMAIQNTGDVPAESKPGDKVELYVFSSDAFRWPTDEVREAAARARQPGHGGRQGGPRGRGRR